MARYWQKTVLITCYVLIRKLVKYPVRVRVSANAFVRDWVRVRVGIRLEGKGFE